MDGFSANYIKAALKLRLDDNVKQKLLSDIHENSSCNNFRIFKVDLNLEDYLLKLDFKDRVNLCKFRCGNHYLPISSLRFKEDKESNRNIAVCKKCESKQIGDEMHYLLECEFFTEDRLKFLGKRKFCNFNIYTVKQVMGTKNVSKLKKLAAFANVIMTVFEAEHELNFVDTVDDFCVNLPSTTRSGRVVSKPDRLNL